MAHKVHPPKPFALTSRWGSLSVSPRGGGLIQWQTKGFPDPILYHHPYDGAALAMGEILSPFPNRLREARFPDGPRSGRLKGVTMRGPHSIHAFVRQLPWAIKKISGGDGIVAQCQWREGEMQHLGYPFGLFYEVRYTLGPSSLCVKTTAKNTGSLGAPFALAFHPYFALSQGVDRAILHLGAKTLRSFSPPPGKLGPPELPEIRDEDFNEPRAIGPRALFGCYGELSRDGQGLSRVHLVDQGWARRVSMFQDSSFPFIQLFGLDIPGPHRRKALAIEPSTSTPFPYDPNGAGMRILGPGEIFEGTWGVTVESL